MSTCNFTLQTYSSTPQPDLITPQPDLVTPQPDLITPQPDLITPQPDIYTPPVPAVPDQVINRNNTSDGITTLLTTTYDYNNSPANIVLTNSYRTFADDGGLSSDYTTSHSRCIIFDAGEGNKIMINPISFETEHSSYSMYDRLGITASNTISGLNTNNLSNSDSTLSQYLYQSSSQSPSTFWGSSWNATNGGYGTGGGWIFPSSSGTDIKGNNNSSWVNTWYVVDARYIKIYFKSDGSATEPGWNFRIARQEYIAETQEVPGFYTPQPDLVTPQPDLVTPQPDLVTPQPDLVTPQPDLVTPQPDLITPQPDLIVPQPDIITNYPSVPAQVINRNNTSDGITTLLTTTYDYANSPANIVLTNSYRTFTDDGGLSSDYTTSHSRCIIFDAGTGNKIMINPISFETEHKSYSMYDRLGITASNTISGLNTNNLSNSDSTLSQYLYQSSLTSPTSFWGSSWNATNGGYGTGGGWIFPSSSGTDIKGNNNSSWVNTWYVVDARYIKIYFKSDGSATEPGWNFRIARQENIQEQPAYTVTTPQPDLVVPQPDLITPSPYLITPQPDLITPQPDIYTPPIPAVPDQLINRNNTSDGTTTLLTNTYDYNNSPANIVLTNSYRTFADDGGLSSDYTTSHSRCIIFDAGEGNKIMINPISFVTEHSSYSMYDRLGITASNTISGLNTNNLSNADSTLSQYLYQSSSTSPASFWGSSWNATNGGYGTGGGWIFPSSSGTDIKGNNNSSWVNTWYVVDARYIKIYFKSDGSSTEPGWNFRIAKQEYIAGTPEVPGFYTPQPDLVTPQPDLVTPQPDTSTVTYCATGLFYVSLDLIRSVFLFATPIADCSLNTSVFNDSQADISYNVLSALYPDINPVHAMMGSSLSEGIIRTDSSSNQLIKHDFIFYLAEKIFTNSSAAFLLSNVKELKREIEEIGWLYKNNIEQVLTTAYNSGLGMTNTITDKSNLTRRFLKQIEHFEPGRLVCNPNDISSGIIDTDGFQSVPFIEGDSISIFFTLTSSVEPRIYRLLLYLTNDLVKLSSNVHPNDSVINDTEYQGNITNDGVP